MLRLLIPSPAKDRNRLGLSLLAGFLWVQYWAECMDYGTKYGAGKVLSASLMFGLLAAILIPNLATFFTLLLSHLLYKAKGHPIPEKENRKKRSPWKGTWVPTTDLTAPHWVRSRFLYQHITYSLRPLYLLGILQAIELAFYGENAFVFSWDFLFVLKTLIIFCSLGLWIWLGVRSFAAWKPAWLSVAGGLLLSLLVTILLFAGIFKLPIVA